MSENNWYVVQTKPRQEKVAVENLERQGYVTYCPQIVQPKRLRQRWQKVREPLFPRYLFVRLNVGIDNFSPIRSTLGVHGFVKFGGQPAVMPINVIDAIRQQEQMLSETCTEHPDWDVGEQLQILDGPFEGLKGIFMKKVSLERVSILLNILGRQNQFNIHIDSLRLAY